MNSDRYERGVKMLNEIDSQAEMRLVIGFKDVAPDMAKYAIEFAYGDIYTRPGLDLKTREIVAVSALAALGNATLQLKSHINNALNVGCTRQEIVEIIIEMAVFAGFPAALNGMAAAKEIFQQRDEAGLS
jgi:4-carboxymuconolactone decarboxylase